MPDQFSQPDDAPLCFDAVRDELGRVPIIGPGSDRELFLDLPIAGLVRARLTDPPATINREFLANDFGYGI
jgi:hypothetical protein